MGAGQRSSFLPTMAMFLTSLLPTSHSVREGREKGEQKRNWIFVPALLYWGLSTKWNSIWLCQSWHISSPLVSDAGPLFQVGPLNDIKNV